MAINYALYLTTSGSGFVMVGHEKDEIVAVAIILEAIEGMSDDVLLY